MGIVDHIRAAFSWRIYKPLSGVNLYFENAVTGDRKVLCPARHGYQPIAWSWLKSARGRALYLDQFGDWIDAKAVND